MMRLKYCKSHFIYSGWIAMKIFIPLTVSMLFLVTACSGIQKETRVTPGQTLDQTAADYHCESNETLFVIYDSSGAVNVEYQEKNYLMKVAISASGARYVGEGLEWWVKSSGMSMETEGTLFQHKPDGTTGDVIERCVGHFES
jgi:membrane-bound inhibitor of C-type lysozyme